MTNKVTLGRYIQNFFEKYLGDERGSPATTVASYSITIKLLLKFASDHLKKTIDALCLKDLDDHLVLKFLNHLEADRGNSPQSRNNRLAAICTFVRYLAREEPLMLAACASICSISPKNVIHKVVPSLSVEEVKAFLAVIERTHLSGLRDYALFKLLYNTGARVSEITNLKITDIRLQKPYRVTLMGKGGKQRIVPLWDETAQAITDYLEQRIEHQSLFLNRNGQPLTRFGIGFLTEKYWLLAQHDCPSLVDIKVTPHTFRHTCACHSIESGNHPVTVQDWLGHAHFNTTSRYLSISMKMKEKALKAFRSPEDNAHSDRVRLWEQPTVIQYLENLVRPNGPNFIGAQREFLT